MKVLAVEDSESNQVILQFQFEALGVQCDVVGTALEAIRAMSLPNQYAAIVMDCGLPGINGFECARMLRAYGILIPIIALTGYSDRESHAVCLASGMNAVLTKPCPVSHLKEVINTWVPGLCSEPTEDILL